MFVNTGVGIVHVTGDYEALFHYGKAQEVFVVYGYEHRKPPQPTTTEAWSMKTNGTTKPTAKSLDIRIRVVGQTTRCGDHAK